MQSAKSVALYDFGDFRRSLRICKSLKNHRVQDRHRRDRPWRKRIRIDKTRMSARAFVSDPGHVGRSQNRSMSLLAVRNNQGSAFAALHLKLLTTARRILARAGNRIGRNWSCPKISPGIRQGG
jgi:hypothetical protein